MFGLTEHTLFCLPERIRTRAAVFRLRSPVVALLLLATAAAGPPHPLFAPSRDVSVEYRLESPDARAPGGKAVDELRLHATRDGELLRLDTPASGAYLLIDRARHTATVVDPKIHAFMSGPLNPKVASGLLLLDPAGDYRRAGSAEVAGHACERWTVGPDGRNGSACVTADGVVLSRVEGSDPAHEARLTAVSVAYGPQPQTLFLPPPGYQDLSAVKPPAGPARPVGPPAATAPQQAVPPAPPPPPPPGGRAH